MAYTTINKGSDYFNTKLYTGTGATLSITGVGFQPDFVWTKGRNVAFSHYLMDSVRGVGRRIMSNSTSNEDINIFGVSSFDSDGFTLGTDTGANNNGSTFASWNWLAANGTASNTQGSITSTVSANTTSGFSIVSYTGNGSASATIGHGLGTSNVGMIITKNRDQPDGWIVYHKSLGANNYLVLQTTDPSDVSANKYLSVPTSTTYEIGNSGDMNTNTEAYIAYCFAEVKGFSKFGKYDGNAGVGAFVNNFQHLGFKPAFVMIKCYNAAESWNVFDNKRNGYNYQNDYLIPNDTNAEVSAPNQGIDLLSNGFNPYYGTGTINRSGKSYIYMAFAENPFVGSDGTPTTAR